MSAATLPLDLATAVTARLVALRPALAIQRVLFLPLGRSDLATLRVFVAPSGRTHKADTRRTDEHKIRLEIAIAKSLTGPDYDAEAAAVLATAFDLYGLWTANSDDDEDDGPLRRETPAKCRFSEADHDPLLDAHALARGLALAIIQLTYAATCPQ